jgi:hypothetical protein
VDYLNAFDHTGTDVEIFWDTGPSTGQNQICTPGKTSEDVWAGPANNNTRLVVKVTGHFNAIVRLVPLPTRTIVATSRRTILVSVSIVVPNPAADTTSTALVLTPHRVPDPHSNLGELVNATATVTNTSGTDTPTGTVDIKVDGVVICPTVALTGGVASCNFNFANMGTFNVEAVYNPDTTDFSNSSASVTQIVGKAATAIVVTDSGDPSVINTAVAIHVEVTSASGVPVPTGTVSVSTAVGNCTITLNASGEGDCPPMIYTALGTTLITAVYNGDAQHLTSTDSSPHEVLSQPATPSNTSPPPTLTFTAPPPTITFTPTPMSTPVVGCTNIQVPTGQTITLSGRTMYLNIYNPMTYNVTIKDVFLRWNYLQGFNGHDLHLVSAQMNSNIFWGPGDVHAPSYSPPLSGTVIIPANTTSQILFTFDKLYTRSDNEQIQLSFNTPGCEEHTINVIK